MAQLEGDGIRGNASKMIRLVIEAGYDEHLKENYPNYLSRLDDLEQLASFALQFPSVEDFLTQPPFLTNVGAEARQPGRPGGGRRRASNIYPAKGPEFDLVF